VAARGKHAIVLVDDLAAAAHGKMLDDAEGEDHVEVLVGIGQSPRLLVGEEPHVAHPLEGHLLDLEPDHGREGRIRVEGDDLAHLGALGEVLRDVAEGAADLEDVELAGVAAAEIGEERVEEVMAASLFVGEVLGRARRSLALHEHLDHAGAVGRRIVAPVHREHAAITQVLETVGRLAHRSRE